MPNALDDYDFELPAELIAQQPTAQRDGGRLLQVDDGVHPMTDLPTLLKPDDLLIVNDSRVLPARLLGTKTGGGRVEILLERILAQDECLAQCGSAKALKTAARIHTAAGDFIVLGRLHGLYHLRAVAAHGDGVADVKRRFVRNGQTPLPPYIRRPPTEQDKARYQTIFARPFGSVAAPTAGLHFSPTMLTALAARGIRTARLTLHVGAGTFAPIRGSLDAHVMHDEFYAIPARTAAAIATAKKQRRRVVAIGTTVLRALEAAAADADDGTVQKTTGRTNLFIRPGFDFRVADALFTNFHLPRSSLLLLVCAFGGRRRVLTAYQRAVADGLRFYSYGDAMLLTRTAARL